MIIVVCTDDPSLVQIANASWQVNQAVFGSVHQVFGNQIPQLQPTESLFLIAHGVMEGDDNNPVIGDRRKAFYVNAPELFQGLQAASVFPPGYTGTVYIDACEAADNSTVAHSFMEAFLAVIQDKYGQVRVYGRVGVANGLIPLPGADGWQQA